MATVCLLFFWFEKGPIWVIEILRTEAALVVVFFFFFPGIESWEGGNSISTLICSLSLLSVQGPLHKRRFLASGHIKRGGNSFLVFNFLPKRRGIHFVPLWLVWEPLFPSQWAPDARARVPHRSSSVSVPGFASRVFRLTGPSLHSMPGARRKVKVVRKKNILHLHFLLYQSTKVIILIGIQKLKIKIKASDEPYHEELREGPSLLALL